MCVCFIGPRLSKIIRGYCFTSFIKTVSVSQTESSPIYGWYCQSACSADHLSPPYEAGIADRPPHLPCIFVSSGDRNWPSHMGDKYFKHWALKLIFATLPGFLLLLFFLSLGWRWWSIISWLSWLQISNLLSVLVLLGRVWSGACTILPQTFERFDYGVVPCVIFFFSFYLAKIHWLSWMLDFIVIY